jgi:predicted transcriptional regulator
MNNSINLRIEDGVKDALTEMASQKDQKLSLYIREILVEYVENHGTHEDLQNSKDSKGSNTNSDKPKNQDSQEYKDPDARVNFYQMILWVNDRNTQPLFNNSRQFLLSIKKQVEIAIMDSPFSPELKMEFMKILEDINRVLKEPEGYNKRFDFSLCGSPLSFNYGLLRKELVKL